MRKMLKPVIEGGLLVLLAFSLFLFPPIGRAIAFAQELTKTGLVIKGNKVNVEIAITSLQQSCGLMFRTSLEKDSGMLFFYKESKVLSFWMKDTNIPLTIAFIDEKGVIVDLHDLKPKNLTPVESRGKVKYALEMNKGWFKNKKIKVGDKVEGLEKIK